MNRYVNHSTRSRRGIIITDAVIGLSLLGVILSITAVGVGYDLRARRAAKQHRQLTLEAEAALLSLQNGQAPASPEDDMISVAVSPIAQAQAPEGYAWVNASAAGYDQSITVAGLLPTEVLSKLPGHDAGDAPANAGESP